MLACKAFTWFYMYNLCTNMFTKKTFNAYYNVQYKIP